MPHEKNNAMKKSIPVLVFCFVLLGCSKSPNEAISTIQISGRNTNLFYLEGVSDSISLRLSDIANDLHFIQLETKPECLLNRPEYYVGNDYIMAFERGGSVFQFDIQGKYIRTIAKQGKGPTELTSYIWAVDGVSNIVYLKDRFHEYLLSFDLTTGNQLSNIPLAMPCDVVQIVIAEPGILVIAPALNKSNEFDPYYAFWQDSKGSFLGGISASEDVKVNHGSQILFQESNNLYYFLSKTDTLYAFEEYERFPDWVFELGSRNPEDRIVQGARTLRVISNQENFMLNSLFIAGETKAFENGRATDGKLFYLFINKKDGEASYLSQLIVDILEPPARPVLLKTQSNGTMFIPYNALNLKELIKESLNNSELSQDRKSELEKLDSRISIEDNPLLLVGVCKH